ncbi:hypothetical protein F4604DRAFT_1919597 [Suillus subluteus]|nr:hypothetical protein F4604DRAFT_1919597 [Suillus subluteus]
MVQEDGKSTGPYLQGVGVILATLLYQHLIFNITILLIRHLSAPSYSQDILHVPTELFCDIALPFQQYNLPITSLDEAFPIAELFIVVMGVLCRHHEQPHSGLLKHFFGHILENVLALSSRHVCLKLQRNTLLVPLRSHLNSLLNLFLSQRIHHVCQIFSIMALHPSLSYGILPGHPSLTKQHGAKIVLPNSPHRRTRVHTKGKKQPAEDPLDESPAKHTRRKLWMFS